MSPSAREVAVLAELQRSAACLAEARALLALKLSFGSTSRAYFAAFHAGRALLASLGLEERSHKGVVSLIGLHFVQTGKLPSPMGRVFAHLQRDREDADFDSAATFTHEEATALLVSAETFCASCRIILGTA